MPPILYDLERKQLCAMMIDSCNYFALYIYKNRIIILGNGEIFLENRNISEKIMSIYLKNLKKIKIKFSPIRKKYYLEFKKKKTMLSCVF